MTSARSVALNNEGKEHNVLGGLLVLCHEGKSYGLRSTYGEQPLCHRLYVPARAGIATIAPPVNQRPEEVLLSKPAACVGLSSLQACAMQMGPAEKSDFSVTT